MSLGKVARALIAAMLISVPTLLTGPAVGPAGAAPTESDDVPDQTVVTLPWAALGLNQSMVLGPNASTGVTVPVPAGLTATRLQGVIQAPMNVSAGYLEIDDDSGKFVGAVYVPPVGPDRIATPLDIDISSVRGQSTSINLSFAFHPIERADEVCATQQLTLDGLATVFTGSEPPLTSVASFFPPVIGRFTIYTPIDSDDAEKQAALTLVSTLQRLYVPQPLVVTVVPQPRGAIPPPAPPMAHSIVVESGTAGLSVENPGNPGAYLRISGRGDALTAQMSLLVNQLQTLVQSPAARVDQAGSTESPRGDTLTFSQLKMAGKTDVLRTGSMTVGIDRSSLGAGRVDSVTVHLLADYTPVRAGDAAAVVIRSKGIVVYSALLGDTGRLDATFDLPRQTFGQWINLDFALTYTPVQPCGPLLAPITFQVDPRSTLTMHRGGPPLDGFAAVPSEFSPGFMVALDGSSPNQLSYAAEVISAVARLTPSQLMPQLVDVKTAAEATTGALIVAKSSALAQTSLDPPVGGDGASVNFNLPNELRANIDSGLGSIQAFADRPRNRSVVLVTTTGEWSLVDPLFTYIDGLTGGWAQLNGDVLAAGLAGVPTNVAIRAEGSTFDPPPPREMNLWLVGGIGAAAVAVIAILAATLWSSRRRRTAPPDHEPVTTPPQQGT